MSEKAKLTMISVFEEAVSQILIPKMPDKFSMKVELTCSEDLTGGEFRIHMNSDGMILDKDNSLVDKFALDILRARSKELEIIHDEMGSGFDSQVVVRF